MTAKVIQGSFVVGGPRLSRPVAQPTAMPRLPGSAFAGHAPLTRPRLPGPPAPAFAGHPAAVQRHGAGNAFAVDSAALGLASGGGKPLPDSVRGQMEAALGANFSNVRVHVGPQAERIGAIAFTVGSDIYFAPGRYQPATVQGRQLLGHELAHVVQQRAGRVKNPLGSGLAVVQDHALEAEADRLGQRAAIRHVATAPSNASLHESHRTAGILSQRAQGTLGHPSLTPGATLQHRLAVFPATAIQPMGWENDDEINLMVTQIIFFIIFIITFVAIANKAYKSWRRRKYFDADGIDFERLENFNFTSSSALAATRSVSSKEIANVTRRSKNSGTRIGDMGSYSSIQYIEQANDGLTCDHQPGGAQIKENLRQLLHSALNQVLTRQMAKNAYQRAVGIVMSDIWHKASSRTYGGRNKLKQIQEDVQNLAVASMKDWEPTVPELRKHFTVEEIKNIWRKLNKLRRTFFSSGSITYSTAK